MHSQHLKSSSSAFRPALSNLWLLLVIYLFSVPISLCRRFLIATTNLLHRSVFFISVSDVDSNFSLRLEDSEAEGENDEWWVVLQVSNL